MIIFSFCKYVIMMVSQAANGHMTKHDVTPVTFSQPTFIITFTISLLIALMVSDLLMVQ